MEVKKVRVIISNSLAILLSFLAGLYLNNYLLFVLIIFNVTSIYFIIKLKNQPETNISLDKNTKELEVNNNKEVELLKNQLDRLTNENSEVINKFHKAFENYKAIEISIGNTDKISKKAVSIVQDKVNSLTDGIFSLLGSSKTITDDINNIISSVALGENSLQNVINNLNNNIIKIDSIVNDIDEIRIETLKESNTISDIFHKIKNITANITELAEQTGVLAINATIEAARTGIHGKGFAVIAGEVRKLSDNSKEMAETINHMINDTHKAVEESYQKQNFTIGNATNSLKATQDNVKGISFGLNKKIEVLSESIKKSSYMSEELTEKLNNFTNSIQFLDLVRQIIEHINSIHKEIHTQGYEAFAESNLDINNADLEKRCLDLAIRHFTSKEEREALGLNVGNSGKFNKVKGLDGDVTLF